MEWDRRRVTHAGGSYLVQKWECTRGPGIVSEDRCRQDTVWPPNGGMIGPASQAILRLAPHSPNLRVVLCLAGIRCEPTGRTPHRSLVPSKSYFAEAPSGSLGGAKRCSFRTKRDNQLRCNGCVSER